MTATDTSGINSPAFFDEPRSIHGTGLRLRRGVADRLHCILQRRRRGPVFELLFCPQHREIERRDINEPHFMSC